MLRDRLPRGRLVGDAVAMLLVAGASMMAAVRLNIRDPIFQGMFVVVCGSAAAQRLIAQRLGEQRQRLGEQRQGLGQQRQGLDQQRQGLDQRQLSCGLDSKSLVALLGAGASMAWLSTSTGQHQLLSIQVVMVPHYLRWVGVALGLVSVADPFLNRDRSDRQCASNHRKALISLLLLAANGFAALLACVAVPIALGLVQRKEFAQ